MGVVNQFDAANNILKTTFGYHIDPANGDHLRSSLRMCGMSRFRAAVAIVRTEFAAGRIDNHPQEIHAAIEYELSKLRPKKRAGTKYRNPDYAKAKALHAELDAQMMAAIAGDK